MEANNKMTKISDYNLSPELYKLFSGIIKEPEESEIEPEKTPRERLEEAFKLAQKRLEGVPQWLIDSNPLAGRFKK